MNGIYGFDHIPAGIAFSKLVGNLEKDDRDIFTEACSYELARYIYDLNSFFGFLTNKNIIKYWELKSTLNLKGRFLNINNFWLRNVNL